MSSTIEIKNKIKSELEKAYRAAGKNPTVITTLFPVTESGNDELEREAKGKADNGIVFIGRGVRDYTGDDKSGVYEVQDPYLILIYSNNKNSDDEITRLFDIARDCLYTFIKLDSDYIADLKGYKSGLYMAWIRCIWEPYFYDGTETYQNWED